MRPTRPAPSGPLAVLAAAVLALAPLFPASASAACAVAGSTFSDGASACLPAVRGGAVRPVLHGCEGDRWVAREAVCPDAYAYFCRVGPHAVEVGERLLLGSGPQSLECRFPGVLALVGAPAATPPMPAAGATTSQAPASRTIRRVQAFLTEEGAGAASDLSCAGADCSGRADAATLAALAEHLERNARNLTPAETARFGLDGPGGADAAVAAMSPVDLFPLFVETFDVPTID